MRKNLPHWILHSHYFDGNEYECSVCGALMNQAPPRGQSRCPKCNALLYYLHDNQDWVDELEELDIILEDD